MIVGQVFAVLCGALLVFSTLSSAVRTVIVPRGEQSHLNRLIFGVTQIVFATIARRRAAWVDQDRMLARFAPAALMLLPVVWSTGVVAGFTGIYWGVNPSMGWRDALLFSGSSMTTLGFRSTSSTLAMLFAIAEAVIGLGIVALMISFLPTMYAAFSHRETAVYRMAIRTGGVGDSTSHAALFVRWWTVGAFDRFEELWDEWELWFVELEETHTTFPALNFFRSPEADRSWITAAGMALDIAALHMSVINTAREPNAALMLRTGYLSLRHVAKYFGITYDPDPAPDRPISITEDEFNAFYDEVAGAGVPVRQDRDLAWRDYAGWRVNYDEVLLALCALTIAPESPWSSDRVPYHLERRALTPFRRRSK